MYKFNLDEFLLGCLLGDSSLEYRKNYIANISFSHRTKDFEYLEFKYNYLSQYFDLSDYGFKNNNTIKRFRIYRNEKSINYFDYYRSLVRTEENKRKLPDDLNLITLFSLFIWYLDDGTLTVTKVKRKNSYFLEKSIILALKSYSDEEILKLISYIKDKFDIEFKPKYTKNKIGWITIRRKSEIIKFLDKMKDFYIYVPESLKYKFCLCEIPNQKYQSYKDYNKCDVYDTKICYCRNKDYNL